MVAGCRAESATSQLRKRPQAIAGKESKMSIFQNIFHRGAKVAAPSEPGKTPSDSSSRSEAAGTGVVITCQKCGHKHRKTITAGRAKGGTFATCPQCGGGGIYDEHGQAFSPAQNAARQLARKYGQGIVQPAPQATPANTGTPQSKEPMRDTTGPMSLAARESAAREQTKVMRQKLGILEKAYLCSNLGAGPEELAAIQKMLSDIISDAPLGTIFLAERLMQGVTISGGMITLHNWGEGTWNELLKKQTIIKAFEACKATAALRDLQKLANARCNSSLWQQCITGPLSRAIATLKD